MNFTPLSRLLKFEFRRFKGLSRFALIFLMLMPLIYVGIYLAANWNLYNNIDHIKVAVVNKDAGAQYEGENINAGALLEDALKERPNFDWQFLGKDSEGARKGLEKGNYLMILEVPENFSHNLTSAGAFDPQRASLMLRRDDGNGFVAGMLTSQADKTLTNVLDAAISDTYFNVLFEDLETIRESLDTAATGAKTLDENLDLLESGINELDKAVTHIDVSSLSDNVKTAESGLDSLSEGVKKISASAGDIRAGASDISSVVTRVQTGAQLIDINSIPLNNYINNELPTLKKNVETAQGAANKLVTARENTAASTHLHVKAAKKYAKDIAKDNPELADTDAYKKLISELEDADKTQTNVVSNVADIVQAVKSMDSHTSSLTAMQGTLASIQKANNAVLEASSQISEGAQKIKKGVESTSAASDDIREGLTDLRTTGSDVMAQVPTLIEGITKLTNATGQLNTAAPQLSDGAHELAEGLSNGVEQIPELTDTERERLSEVMSSPVSVTQQVDNEAKYYGRGLAPMFYALGLWVLTISLPLVIRTISGRALAGRGNAWKISMSGFGPIAVISLLASYVLGAGAWFLIDIDPVHPFLYFLLLTVVPLAFMTFAYVVRLWLGSVQTAIFLLLLMVQLPVCGGTFPVDMLEPFWQTIATISPMKYVVDAFRVTISGGYAGNYWIAMAILAGIFVLSYALIVWLIHRRRLFTMRDLYPPMVTSTSTGDNAFMIRPR
ncbi:MAG: YhgE/Pip domain-containing protein [Actinomycetaceae bacterium]|nr:YhgE/Pip domain-containing protein [Actinomycetaceae bacterium]